MAHGHKFVGTVASQNAESIRALEHIHRLFNRFEEIAVIVLFKKICHNLGVGLAAEIESVGNKAGLKLGVIFDNAVVDNGKSAVFRKMRMRVFIRGLSVGGPAGVTDADGGGDVLSAVYLFAQGGQSALCFVYFDGSVFDAGDACRIVTSVFKLCKSVEQNGGYPLLSDISYYSAHKFYLFS